MGMGVTEYGESRRARGLPGASRYAVHRALRTGRITKEEDGTIDPDRADRDWEAHTSEPKSHTAHKSISYQEARAVREALNVRIARLEYEERIGTLVNAEDAKREAFQLGRRVRDRLLAIPGRVTSQILAMDDVKEIERLLEDEFRRALEELPG